MTADSATTASSDEQPLPAEPASAVEVPQDTLPDGQVPADGSAALLDQLAAAEAERESFRDKWMRAEAEMQNVRARARREADEARQYATQKLARDMAEVADNLRRGLDSLPIPAEAEDELLAKLRDGFAGVERSFLATLERHGVARTDPTGQPFDPDRHQAMSEQPSAEHKPGTVIQAWTAAWTLHGRLLRPAMVVVAAGAPQPSTDDLGKAPGIDVKA